MGNINDRNKINNNKINNDKCSRYLKECQLSRQHDGPIKLLLFILMMTSWQVYWRLLNSVLEYIERFFKIKGMHLFLFRIFLFILPLLPFFIPWKHQDKLQRFFDMHGGGWWAL